MKGDFRKVLGEGWGGTGRRATKSVYRAPLLGKTVTTEKAITKPTRAPKAISHTTLFHQLLKLKTGRTTDSVGEKEVGPRGTPSPQHILLSERTVLQVPSE